MAACSSLDAAVSLPRDLDEGLQTRHSGGRLEAPQVIGRQPEELAGGAIREGDGVVGIHREHALHHHHRAHLCLVSGEGLDPLLQLDTEVRERLPEEFHLVRDLRLLRVGQLTPAQGLSRTGDALQG